MLVSQDYSILSMVLYKKELTIKLLIIQKGLIVIKEINNLIHKFLFFLC